MLGIVIPAYKREDCLREALDSLIGQTKKDFTVIVVDDHSPKPLKKVVKEYSKKLNIIYKYAEVNGGPGAARQIGLETCYEQNLEYVMFLDSDDLLFPHAVERLMHEIVNTGCDFISSMIWQDHGNHIGAKIASNNQTWLHGKIFRLSYLKEKEIIFPPLRANEDVAFNLIAMECAEKKGYLDEILYLFRYQQNSLTKGAEKSVTITSTDYIAAIYYVATYMRKHINGITRQILINTFALYNFYQTAKNKNIITPEVKKQIKYLANQPEFLAVLATPQTMKEFSHLLNQFGVEDGKVIFYKQTFIDWLSEVGSWEDIDEDSNN